MTPPPPPSPVPRPISPLVRRRCWTEPAVRLWWLIAAAILTLILAYGGDRFWSWHLENRLILSGVPVSAKIVEAGGVAVARETMKGQHVEPTAQVTLEFDWHGQTQRVDGTLEDRTTDIPIDSDVTIHVDPDDPTVWTYRSEPVSLAQELFLVLILLPIPIALAGWATMQRRKLLAAWKHGDAVAGVVSDRRQTPIAPQSYAVRCSIPSRRDKRLFTVFVPAAGAKLNKSDPIWLILPAPGQRGRPTAAMWYQ